MRPGGAAAKNVVNTFPGAEGAATRSGAIKSFLKLFIRKQYYSRGKGEAIRRGVLQILMKKPLTLHRV